MTVSQNLKILVGRVLKCPDFELELDFDRQTPPSNSGQNPDSAVRRCLFRSRSILVQKFWTELSARIIRCNLQNSTQYLFTVTFTEPHNEHYQSVLESAQKYQLIHFRLTQIRLILA